VSLQRLALVLAAGGLGFVAWRRGWLSAIGIPAPAIDHVDPGASDTFQLIFVPPSSSSSPVPVARPQGPRGIRNHNPGNIRRSADRWQGMSAQQTDAEYVQFDAPEWGLRALAKVLLNYQAMHRLQTLAQIVNRWAPASENNTSSYIAHVSALSGIPVDAVLSLRQNPEQLRALMAAMIQHENGAQPYSSDLIAHGIQLALAG